MKKSDIQQICLAKAGQKCSKNLLAYKAYCYFKANNHLAFRVENLFDCIKTKGSNQHYTRYRFKDGSIYSVGVERNINLRKYYRFSHSVWSSNGLGLVVGPFSRK